MESTEKEAQKHALEMFEIFEKRNNNEVTLSLDKPHEYSYRPNTFVEKRHG